MPKLLIDKKIIELIVIISTVRIDFHAELFFFTVIEIYKRKFL